MTKMTFSGVFMEGPLTVKAEIIVDTHKYQEIRDKTLADKL